MEKPQIDVRYSAQRQEQKDEIDFDFLPERDRFAVLSWFDGPQ